MDEHQSRALQPELDRFLDLDAPLFGRAHNQSHGRLFVQGLLRGGDRRNVENIAEARDGPPVRPPGWSWPPGPGTTRPSWPGCGPPCSGCWPTATRSSTWTRPGSPKKGDKSVGVKRQSSGTLGRTDNCQIGGLANYGSAPRP